MKRTKDFLILLIFCTAGMLLLQSNNKIISIKNNSFEFSIIEYIHENEYYKHRYVVFENDFPLCKLLYRDTSEINIVDYNSLKRINNTIYYHDNSIGDFFRLIIHINDKYYFCTDEIPYSFYSESNSENSEIHPLLISESNGINVFQFSDSKIDSTLYYAVPYEEDINTNLFVFNELKTNGMLASLIEKYVLINYFKLKHSGVTELDKNAFIEEIKDETTKDIIELINSCAHQIKNRCCR